MHMRPLGICNMLLIFELNLLLTVFLFAFLDSWPYQYFNVTIWWLKIFEKPIRMVNAYWELRRSHRISSRTPRRRFFGQKWKSPKYIFHVFRGPVLENYWKLRDQMGHLPLSYNFRLPHFYHQSVGGGVSELFEK